MTSDPTSAIVAELAALAASLNAQGDHFGAVEALTKAIALSPHDVSLLEARSGACARLDKHAACLHDGELIVRLTPDWYRGHAICGSALFCLKQYTASVLAYRRALGFAVGSPAERGLQSALVDACGRVDGALRQCSMLGDTTQLCSLLSSGAARIDAPDEKHGFTPLLLAAAAGHPGCVRALLDGGACAGARDRYGKTALMWAAAQRHEGVADVLLRRCASEAASLVATDSAGWDALHAACLSGCLPLVERLLPLADVGRAAVDGSTYLHAAAQGGHVAVARLLLDRRADPSARQTRGKRPLDLASAARKSEVVALLRPLTPELPPSSCIATGLATPTGRSMAIAVGLAFVAVWWVLAPVLGEPPPT
ncbi:hypothetical protein EMIHUDRAFT_216711 [Emiliania huxleyi CCMP1516]|uniref:Ankyrin repeat protein n=2 Tax=Emiliania huxleyi TaxID=2903 RepID=A0A0D3IDH5_EMIH1|nr:hypothetical protein EMIHUDRAFT_216711 [Emiliania huxleyi CCMP1516]EOD09310.1 hypothetical protein EMIHUDRAFT_216711 [Emiliania huxleyi CCMP1516]|eukprot:XP_005761739.1 hypothetical protein EMIHUDRAFT_216711 [Emiliania huxleyi CCMP1516]